MLALLVMQMKQVVNPAMQGYNFLDFLFCLRIAVNVRIILLFREILLYKNLKIHKMKHLLRK
jgi:hypothetical protein